MKYFIPNYVHEEKADNKVTVSNLLNGAVIEFSQDEAWEYYNLKQMGTDEIDTPIMKTLFEEEVLIDAEKQRSLYRECIKVMDSILYLTIMPTENCNFRCIYCYENHDAVNMTADVLNGIKCFVSTLLKTHSFSSIRISWFGGEPLLTKYIIKDFMNYIREEVKGEISVYSFITTNGYFLDSETLIELVDVGVSSFHITLDGWKHDLKRPHKNGNGTLNAIIQNLKDIHNLPLSVQYEVLIRNNILANDDDYSWYDYLKQEFGNDSRFLFSVVTVGKLGGKNDDIFEVEEDHQLEKKHLSYLEKIGLKTMPLVNDYALSGVCAAGYRYGYLFRADGRIGKCTIELEDPINQIGEICEDGAKMNNMEKKWNEDVFDSVCCSCPDGLICLNRNCPIKRMKNNISHLCIRV